MSYTGGQFYGDYLDSRPITSDGFREQGYGPTRLGEAGRVPASSSARSHRMENYGWWTEEEARIYAEWASTFGSQGSRSAANAYFDYFYAGSDVQVSIEAGSDLPVYALGYQIQQEKVPVYGFASYTYDAVLRGTRIVSGVLSLVTSDHHALHKAITTSANYRALAAQMNRPDAYNPIRTERDQANLKKYWGGNLDVDSNQHLFSTHPPFNLLLKFGIQDVSVGDSYEVDETVARIRSSYGDVDKQRMWTDVNERLVEKPVQRIDILLENIDIISKSTQVDSTGQPVMETYTFMARDERLVSS